MSQLTLTPEEDVLVLNSVRARYAQTLSAFGVEDPDLIGLLAKIEAQLAPAPVVEPEAIVEAPEEAPATKSKKVK